MHEDLHHHFAFGITMEDMQLRLWLSNCVFLAVMEPINFFKFTIGNEVFTTTHELATYGADSMVGHGTCMYKATDAKGMKVALKDSWREAGHQSEGKILENILASNAKKLQAKELMDAKRHFIGVWLWKDVIINDAPDETLEPMLVEEHNPTWVFIDLNPIISVTPHLPSTGDIPHSGQLSTFFPIQLGIIVQKDTGILHRVHTRTIFHDVGVVLKDVTSLADNQNCLSGALLVSGTQFGSGVWGSWVTLSL
ncbi:hypothetical protein BDR04DRAFT_1118335 [Suillus decipiens]|nr:hypothetical protein BDR04DRAFT_1118335 [Suillus decipiens]